MECQIIIKDANLMKTDIISKQLKGRNLESVQEENRSSVLRMLKKKNVCSRAEIATALGLKQATITNIINDFLTWGLVRETGFLSGSKGRRSIGVELRRNAFYVIGLRLRRNNFKIGLFDVCGENVFSIHQDYNKREGPRKVVELMRNSIQKVIRDNPDKTILAVGIAVPGPYFADKGVISSLTDFPGWEGISFRDEITKDINIPVVIDHDSNAGALAEWWLAPNEQISGTLVYIGAGDGIGAGILHDGVVFRGALGIAGEIGHMSIDKDGPICDCGNRGCLTNYVSTTYMTQRVNRSIQKYPETILKKDCSFEEFVNAVNHDDPLAMAVFRDVAHSLSVGLVNLICAYDPNEIIISDRISLLGEKLIVTLMEMLTEKAKQNYFGHVSLKLGPFARDSAYIGAAALAIDYCFGTAAIFNQT